MKSKHTILYVPGLGDHDFALSVRIKLLSLWRFKNVSVETCVMDWTIDEPWQKKLDHLLSKIDRHSKQGDIVSLVGESAGASAVIQALNLRTESLYKVILLCGKSQFPERVAAARYSENPAFKEALSQSHTLVPLLTREQRSKLINLHPLFDPTVPVAETKISGVADSYMPIVGHATSIIFANTVWSWWFVRKVRSRD